MTCGVAASISCPHCGGPVEWVTGGRPTTWRAVGMLRCDPCRRDYRAELTLIDVKAERLALQEMDRLADALYR